MAVADTVVAGCARCHGLSLEAMSDAPIDAYLDAKTKDLPLATHGYSLSTGSVDKAPFR